MRKLASALTLLLLSINIYADALYITYPQASKTYENIAKNLADRLNNVKSPDINHISKIELVSNAQLPSKKIPQDALIVSLNNIQVKDNNEALSGNNFLFTFNSKNNYSNINNKTCGFIYIGQPIDIIVNTAKKTIKSSHKRTTLIIVSEKNKSAIDELENLTKNNKDIKVIIIKEGEVAAKIIEPALYNTGAIAAIQDPDIWSGNSARWILQQAYNYKVPIIGYSKAFLKAGAMVSVYSTENQILEETEKQIIKWAKTGELKRAITYPNYTIETNENIAKALNFTRQEIIDIGKKQ